MRKYVLTPQADADLEEIFFFTVHKWGAKQAEEYLELLHRAMCRLANDEIKGKDCSPLLLHKSKELFYYHVQRHYVIYRAANNGVEIIALYHDRMDLPRHLAKLA
jgi:toxin ParE1/3/4